MSYRLFPGIKIITISEKDAVMFRLGTRRKRFRKGKNIFFYMSHYHEQEFLGDRQKRLEHSRSLSLSLLHKMERKRDVFNTVQDLGKQKYLPRGFQQGHIGNRCSQTALLPRDLHFLVALTYLHQEKHQTRRQHRFGAQLDTIHHSDL